MSNLTFVEIGDNPLISLSLPEESTGLTNLLASLKNSGVQVYLYPQLPALSAQQASASQFQFALNGPPGVYSLLVSTNLVNWSTIGKTTNQLGTVSIRDSLNPGLTCGFYRVTLAQ
jgi:hypothetical protein